MGLAADAPGLVRRAVSTAIVARAGRFRAWPPADVLLEAPLALAEERASRLRRIYANSTRDAWDGPAVFRRAVEKHGGIQLSREKRIALAHPIGMLMWGELGAWLVAAEFAERLEDPDARLAASSQVFDEARHFYVLRDYAALLHVPVPPLDTYFKIAVRRLLMARDLTLKLFAMQIIAEGTAQAIFQFLVESEIEPVLSELLPFIERDEARHVGLGIVHLPERLGRLSPRRARRVARRAAGIADLFGATQIRYARHYQTLGADPRRLLLRADRMLFELSRQLGPVPGTDRPYLPGAGTLTRDDLDFAIPQPGVEPTRTSRWFQRVVEFGAHHLPA